jgi:biotin transport system substrate-specific component
MAQAIAREQGQDIGHVWLLNIGLVIGGSLLMAICAHVSIPLWFTPVPITLQTFGVAVLALTLGGWRASAALALYLVEGLSGLPVFSPHGPGGMLHIFGPTGGYLMAYPFAALAGGLLAEKFARRSRIVAFSLGAVASDAIILLCGALWLFALTHRPMQSVLVAAVLPFLPGEVLKASAAVAIALGKEQRLQRR